MRHCSKPLHGPAPTPRPSWLARVCSRSPSAFEIEDGAQHASSNGCDILDAWVALQAVSAQRATQKANLCKVGQSRRLAGSSPAKVFQQFDRHLTCTAGARCVARQGTRRGPCGKQGSVGRMIEQRVQGLPIDTTPIATYHVEDTLHSV